MREEKARFAEPSVARPIDCLEAAAWLYELKLDGHRALVSSVAFTAEGRRALSGDWDGKAILWDLERA